MSYDRDEHQALRGDNDMFFGATSIIFQLAQHLRHNPTNSETVLWNRLKQKQLGVKFRRQHPVGEFIVDFYSHENRLIIELDGGIHNTQENRELDALRESKLKSLGLKIIRIKNEELEDDVGLVLDRIRNMLDMPRSL